MLGNQTPEELLSKGNVEEAIKILDQLIAHKPSSDELHYIRGKAYYKKGDWQKAIQDYMEAIALNSESPAKETLKFTVNILNFYNKDIYNQ